MLDLNSRKVVVFGASGILHPVVCQGLSKLCIEIVGFADNDYKMWSESVVPPVIAASKWKDAVFVIAIYNFSIPKKQLISLGISDTQILSYDELFRLHSDTFLPYYGFSLEPLQYSGVSWADEKSFYLESTLSAWRIGDVPRVAEPDSADETYFPSFLKLREDEVYVDCGAYTGDTVVAYLEKSLGYRKIVAIEPNPQTFVKLYEFTNRARLGIELVNAALYSHQNGIKIKQKEAATHIADDGVCVRSITLDEQYPDATLIKMDIEGSEYNAIRGAENLVRNGKTAFAVTLYHRPQDITEIPQLFAAMNPKLKLFLRHYGEQWAETVCYAIPEDRVV